LTNTAFSIGMSMRNQTMVTDNMNVMFSGRGDYEGGAVLGGSSGPQVSHAVRRVSGRSQKAGEGGGWVSLLTRTGAQLRLKNMHNHFRIRETRPKMKEGARGSRIFQHGANDIKSYRRQATPQDV
jgi:hypothetical protein